MQEQSSSSPTNELRFPEGFHWGAATASYQIEGFPDDDGKAKSIWDEFTHRNPSPIYDGSNADRACGSYKNIAEDVKCIQELGCNYYRFSISWPRALPDHGKSDDPRSAEPGEGLKYYVRLVTALKEAGIESNVTLYHWDLPLALEERGGWRNPAIVDYFQHYAAVVFDALEPAGVGMWSTFNEPWGMCFNGHCIGLHAPGRHNDPGVEPYLCARHLLLAHAHVVRDFREAQRAGRIGIVLNSEWFHPANPDDPGDCEAKERALDFWLHWFADPVFKTGDWPERMKARAGDRLPSFSEEEKTLLLGSSDYFGVNSYSTRLVATNGAVNTFKNLFGTLRQACYMETGFSGLLRTGRDLGRGTHYLKDADFLMTISSGADVTDIGWPVAPTGLGELILHIQERYAPKGGIYVTENGSAWPDRTAKDCAEDWKRVAFQQGYLRAVHAAIQKGADVRGFYLWSLLDNFEWAWGFSKRFGAFHVDYETQKRTAKPIVAWYKKLATSNMLTVNHAIGDIYPERPTVLVDGVAGRASLTS